MRRDTRRAYRQVHDGHEIEEHRLAEQHEGDITYLAAADPAKYVMQTPAFQPDPRRLAALRAVARQRHPHTVPQHGLMRLQLGDDHFLARLDERRRWLDQHCVGSFMFDDLKDPTGNVVGKLYRFEDADEALWFRMLF